MVKNIHSLLNRILDLHISIVLDIIFILFIISLILLWHIKTKSVLYITEIQMSFAPISYCVISSIDRHPLAAVINTSDGENI